jgi:carboxylesterase type B
MNSERESERHNLFGKNSAILLLFIQRTQRKDPAGRINAFHYGSACVQGGQGGNLDEDCLFLNIFTPKVSTAHVRAGAA